jgi:hypothetical protein
MLILGKVDGSTIGEIKPVLLDASGKVLVSAVISSGSIDVARIVAELPAGTQNIGDVDVLTLPALPAGTNRIGSAGSEGWVSSAWKKNPILIGYSDSQATRYLNTALAAGTNTIDLAVISAGEIQEITNMAVNYLGTVAGVTVEVKLRRATINYSIHEWITFVSGVTQSWQGKFILKPSDNIRIIITNATAGDDFEMSLLGLRTDIDQ